MEKPKYLIEVEDTRTIFEKLVENLKEYIDLKARLFKLRAYEKTAQLITYLIAFFFLIGFFLACYILLNIALGFILSDWMESMKAGFATVAVLNLLISIGIFVFRKQLILNPLINFTIGKIMKSESNERSRTESTGDPQSKRP